MSLDRYEIFLHGTLFQHIRICKSGCTPKISKISTLNSNKIGSTYTPENTLFLAKEAEKRNVCFFMETLFSKGKMVSGGEIKTAGPSCSKAD